jgi:hypothetical protein
MYFAFSSAFGLVTPILLLRKLSSFGLEVLFLILYDSNPGGRSLCVKISGILLLPSTVLSDVPQGLVLRPLLFNIFTDNICNIIRDKWIPVTTAGRVLRLRMEERPPDKEGSCEYIE